MINQNIKENENLKIESDFVNLKIDSTIDDNKERVFTNFMFEISEFLNKKEKSIIREVNKSFNNFAFSEFQINLILKSKNESEEFNTENKDLKRIVNHYKNMEKMTIESIRLDDSIIDALEIIVENNRTKIKKLILNNVEYTTNENTSRLLNILNRLSYVNELMIGNVGNRDKLILHIQVNKKEFRISEKIKILKIDNIQTNQIPFIISLFPNLEDLTIENCSLDDELEIVNLAMKDKENVLLSLNLNSNGLAAQAAMESLKKILKKQNKLTNFVLKGLWFTNLSPLIEEFKMLHNLVNLDLSGSKFIFNNSFSVLIFNELKSIKLINLSDCSMEDQDLEHFCINLNESVSNTLEDLILFRNLLSNDSIDSMLKYESKFSSLKNLNLSFNQKINSKGFNILLKCLSQKDNLNCMKNLKHLDMRNTGINLKTSSKNIIDFIFDKNEDLEILDLYFCSFNQNDYVNFVKMVYINSKEKEKKNYRIRIYLKLNREMNKKLFESVAEYRDGLYKGFNILIR